MKISLKLNKQLVHSLLQPKANGQSEDTVTISKSSTNNIEKILQENQLIEEQVENTLESRNSLQIKTLINEQIYNEWLLRHNEAIQDLKDQIYELKFQNERKNIIINELSSTNFRLKNENDIASKSKNTLQTKPIEEIIDLNNKIEEIREILQEKARDIYFLETQKSDIKSLKSKLTEKIIRIQALAINPNNRKNDKEKNIEFDIFRYVEDKKMLEDLSQIKCDFDKICDKNCEKDDKETEVLKEKQEFRVLGEKLRKISEKNFRQNEVNKKLMIENMRIVEKIEYMRRCFFKNDVKEEEEIRKEESWGNVYKNGLESISEYEDNKSNDGERSSLSL
ncbi:hypothetical protein SteCoe_9515 [Stentor coeruleus]|uniref:Uncharacterized protein n=1 Tax=Stentor coeruleus TaxID=5963 RepID=A0A1R2CHT5_9CILI|nr:hypothetical protein SteCoe_9515 [Stentor coeruleus]